MSLGIAPQKIEQVFTDSWLGLRVAHEAGVPQDVLVRTASPAMILSGDPRVRAVDESISPSDVQRLSHSTLPFTHALYDAAKQSDLETEALTVARVGLKFQTIVYKAMAVTEEDLSRPTSVVRLQAGSRHLDRRMNTPWSQIIIRNPNLLRLEVPSDRFHQLLGDVRSPQSSLWNRVRLESLESIAYRIANTFFDVIPVRGRGVILVASENSLLKEVAFHLARRGFVIRSLQAPTVRDLAPRYDLELSLRNCVAPVVHEHLTRWVVAPVRSAVVDLFRRQALEAVRARILYREAWRKRLATEARAWAVFVNFPFSPRFEALHDVCRELGVPLVSAQHGTSREINDGHESTLVSYENASSDVLLTYSERAAELSDEDNDLAVGKSLPIGLSRDYWRVRNFRRPSKKRPPIFYVSTVLYMANDSLVRVGGPDAEKARFEIGIVEKVLSRLSHDVLFKPYPSHSLRYLDPDPVLESASRASNIEVFRQHIDLRYLLPDARVLVTTMGMSTVAWCLMADRPLVYIDHPHFVPLQPEVRARFEKSLFLFDGADPDLHERVRDFLSQPLRVIEQLWEERRGEGTSLIGEVIETGGPGAGKRGARLLLDLSRKDWSTRALEGANP